MKIGIIGLGRMGGNMRTRLQKGGHEAVGFDPNQAVSDYPSLEAMVADLPSPRVVWSMVPSGAVTDRTIEQLAGLLAPGDIVIDGGNSYFRDSIRHGEELAAKQVHFLDIGTSGGVWGLERGYCLMIGGDRAAFERLDPIFATLAPGRGSIPPTNGRDGRDPRVEQGYLYAGASGAGHFVKMIHNGIEYGMMQAIGEGLDILKNAASPNLPPELRLDLDVADVAEVWRRGSVITSWLLDLTAAALASDPALAGYSGHVEDSGEGRWTVQAAIDEAVPAEVLTAALYARFRSRQDHTFAEKVLSAMRKGFGGHVEPTRSDT